jgi:MFS family permease
MMDIAGYDRAFVTWLACLLGTVFDGADFAIFLFFLAPIAAVFHVPVLLTGLVQAASYLASIAGALFCGFLADRFGRRTGLLVSIFLYSVGSVVSAFSWSLASLLVFRVLAGVGIGGEAGIAFSYLGEMWRPRRRGTGGAVLQCMFLVGSALASLLFGILAVRLGPEAWRYAFAILGLAGFLLLPLRLSLPESPVWMAERQRPAEPWATGTSASIWLAGLFATSAFFAAYAVETYGPTALQTVYRLSPLAVSRLSFFGLAVIAGSYVVSGVLSDRLGRRPVAVGGAVFGTVAFAAYAVLLLGRHDLGGHLSLVTLVTLNGMLAAAAPLALVGTWTAELFPTARRARGTNGVYYFGRALGGGAAPLLALLVAHALGADVRLAMVLGGLGSLAGLLLPLRLPETLGRSLLPVAELGVRAAEPGE